MRARAARTPEERRARRAWFAYNGALHGWTTPVAAVLVGPWMLALADHAAGGGGRTLLALGPVILRADALPSAMITVAAGVQLFVLPLLGAGADARAAKRGWLGLSCGAGAVTCALLAATSGGAWAAAGALFVVASLAAGVSELTWNGMLPELAGPAERDHVSSLGSAVGYLGGGLLLAVNLVVVDLHAGLGLSKAQAVRLCFGLAALWWAGWGLPAVVRLRTRPRRAPGAPSAAPPAAWAQLRRTLGGLRTMPHARRYLLSYLLFADAMSAVIALASTFLTHELFGNDATRATPFLFELILLIQFVALGGALGFGRAARRWGAKPALVAALALWSGLVVYAYAGLRTQLDAVVAGVGMGVALGGAGALARSLFSQMVPAGAEATWFSLYEVCSQGTAWVAPLLFTVVVDATGSFRQAILSLVVLFVGGLVVLLGVRPDRAAAEAEAAADR